MREINTIFIPGKLQVGRDKTSSLRELEKHLARYKAKSGDGVLVVTEAISSGESLKVLVHLLKELGFKVDIASVGIENPENEFLTLDREANLEYSNIISGDYSRDNGSTHTPLVHSLEGRRSTGVFKRIGSLKSAPLKSLWSTRLKLSGVDENFQKRINKSREEIDILVNRLVQWYTTKENQN